MKSWLFALGLALCCVVQASEKMPFEKMDLSKINRNGYVIAIATSCSEMEKKLPYMKAAPVSFEVESPEKLKMTMEMAMKHGCQTMKVELKKENGVFITQCGGGGKKIMEYIQMNGESMFTSINVSGNDNCKVITFVAKNLDVIQEHMEDFKTFVYESLGEEKIYLLSTEGMCPRSS